MTLFDLKLGEPGAFKLPVVAHLGESNVLGGKKPKINGRQCHIPRSRSTAGGRTKKDQIVDGRVQFRGATTWI